MVVPNLVVNNATNVRNCTGVESAKKKLEYIEGYVIVTTILIAFLVGFGSRRRRSHNGLLKTSIFIAYVLPMPLVAYTFGQMQLANFRNELFLVWAMFLLIFFGSADCISVYSLEDNENHNRYILEVLVNFYVVTQWISLYNDGLLSLPFVIFQFFALNRTSERHVALSMASRSYGLVKNNKLIADFMAYEHKLSNEDEVDPVSMKGFKYLVKGEEKEQVKVVPPHNQNQLQLTGKAITIDMIWQCEGRLLSSTGDPDGRLKDICLSYALYRLLCRRFAGYPFSESSQVKTWNFVRYGLLSNEDDHERAFRVIEVELAFLYDLFYTKYAAIFSSKGCCKSRSFQLIIVIVGCVTVVPILTNYHTPKNDLNLLTVGGHNVDVLVTRIVVVAILFMELVQYFVFSFSDWTKVQWLCRYVKKPSWQNNKCIEKIIQIVCHRKWLKPWGRNLGQYSLLESYNYNPSKLLYNRCLTPFVNKPRNGQTESNRIKLPLEVKKAIIVSLKTTNGQRLKNGEASLQRNGIEQLSWACRLETQTRVIMVWHIATSLCEIECKQDNLVMKSEHFIVANALSKYCAYLVAFAPRFLPINSYMTEVIFDQVVQEARDVLNGCNSATSKYENMKKIGEDEGGEDEGGEDEGGEDEGGEDEGGEDEGGEDEGDPRENIITIGEDEGGEDEGGEDEGDPGENIITIGEDEGAEDEGAEEEGDLGENIVKMGAILANHLITRIEDNERRWKILAEFWADMMLFVTPSDDSTVHAEYLAKGGKFVTHLWALLSHAGILKRDPAHEDV